MVLLLALLAAPGFPLEQDAPPSVEWQLEELLRDAQKAPIAVDPNGKVEAVAVRGGPSEASLVDRAVDLPPMEVAVGTVEFSAPVQATVEAFAFDGMLFLSWSPVNRALKEFPRSEFKYLPNERRIFAGKRTSVASSASSGQVFQYVLKNGGTSPVRGRIVVRVTPTGAAPLPPTEDRGFVLRGPSEGFDMPVPAGWLFRWTGHADRPLLMAPRSGGRTNFNLLVGAAPKGAPQWDSFVEGLKRSLGASLEGLSLERKEVGRCGEHAAILLSWSFMSGGAPLRSLQYVVASPGALYTLTWSASAVNAAQDFKPAEVASLAFRALK